jgi:hypothetical protein
MRFVGASQKVVVSVATIAFLIIPRATLPDESVKISV